MDGRIKDGGPAFPRVPTQWGDGIAVWGEPGMTLRDYFAAKIAAAMLTMTSTDNDLPQLEWVRNLDGETLAERVAGIAYRMADAMLAERAKVDSE